MKVAVNKSVKVVKAAGKVTVTLEGRSEDGFSDGIIHSKMDKRCSAETKKSGGEPCLEQQERAEPHWSPSNECVGIYGEKFKQLLEWAERKARERAEREQNEQKSDALHNAFSSGNPSS